MKFKPSDGDLITMHPVEVPRSKMFIGMSSFLLQIFLNDACGLNTTLLNSSCSLKKKRVDSRLNFSE